MNTEGTEKGNVNCLAQHHDEQLARNPWYNAYCETFVPPREDR